MAFIAVDPVTNLFLFVNYLIIAFKYVRSILCIYTYFSEALDHCKLNISYLNLKQLLLETRYWDWLYSCLCERSQVARVSSGSAVIIDCNSGVPQ